MHTDRLMPPPPLPPSPPLGAAHGAGVAQASACLLALALCAVAPLSVAADEQLMMALRWSSAPPTLEADVRIDFEIQLFDADGNLLDLTQQEKSTVFGGSNFNLRGNGILFCAAIQFWPIGSSTHRVEADSDHCYVDGQQLSLYLTDDDAKYADSSPTLVVTYTITADTLQLALFDSDSGAQLPASSSPTLSPGQAFDILVSPRRRHEVANEDLADLDLLSSSANLSFSASYTTAGGTQRNPVSWVALSHTANADGSHRFGYRVAFALGIPDGSRLRFDWNTVGVKYLSSSLEAGYDLRPTQLGYSTVASTVAPGIPFHLRGLRALDAHGLEDIDYRPSSTLSLTAYDSGGNVVGAVELLGVTTAGQTAAGGHSYDLQARLSGVAAGGTLFFGVSDQGLSVPLPSFSGADLDVAVVESPPSHLAITLASTGVVALSPGTSFTLLVTILDADMREHTSATLSASSLELLAGGFGLSYRIVGERRLEASFEFGIDGAELRLQLSAHGLIGSLSATVSVLAQRLRLTAPEALVLGSTFTLGVSGEDLLGNEDVDYELSAMARVVASRGELRVERGGGNMLLVSLTGVADGSTVALTVSDGALTGTVSVTVDVVARRLALTAPLVAVSGTSFTLSVRAENASASWMWTTRCRRRRWCWPRRGRWPSSRVRALSVVAVAERRGRWVDGGADGGGRHADGDGVGDGGCGGEALGADGAAGGVGHAFHAGGER